MSFMAGTLITGSWHVEETVTTQNVMLKTN